MRTKSKGLTKKQNEVLKVIKLFYAENKYPPSIRQIANVLKISSPATIHVHLNELIEKGYIKRNNFGNKAIELLVPNEYDTKSDEVINVPLINEGSSFIDNYLEVPNEIIAIPTYLASLDEQMLGVKKTNDDMINVGINEGDIIIIKKCNTAQNGDLVAAYNRDKEIVIKRYFKENGYYRLQTENKNYDPIILNSISIIGTVTGLYRKY